MKEYIYTDNTKFSVLTKDGFVPFEKIRKSKSKTITIYFTNTDTRITVTPDHTFYYDDSGVNTKLANELEVDDWISHEEFGFLKVEKIENSNSKDVFDLVEVKNENHSYLTNGFNSHNCQFQGASNTLLPAEILLRLNENAKEPIDFKFGSLLKIYEQPIAQAVYVLAVDPAEGLGKDYSVCQVLRVMDSKDNKEDEYIKLKQVATYRSNNVKLKSFAQTAIGIGKYYNDAWAMVENNNSCGGLTCHYFWHEYEYENMINPTKGKNGKLGINANKKSKYEANMKLVELLDTFQLEIVDKITIEELNSYEEIKPNVYAAGNTTVHDDTVTSLLWGITFLDSKFYEGYKEDFGSEISEEFEIAPPVFRNASR